MLPPTSTRGLLPNIFASVDIVAVTATGKPLNEVTVIVPTSSENSNDKPDNGMSVTPVTSVVNTCTGGGTPGIKAIPADTLRMRAGSCVVISVRAFNV